MTGKQSRKTFRFRLDEMVNTLREQILSGHYAVGDFLPSEMDLSETFQLSNNSVRKGLDVLVAEGLIEKIPRVGNRIKAPSLETQTVVRLGYHARLDTQAELFNLLAAFQQQHPHIRVETVQIDNNYGYVEDLLMNDMIDVFTVNQLLFRQFSEKSVQQLLEAQEPFEQMYPFLRKNFQMNGAMYAQPFVYSPVILCYNREHFRECQLPEPDSSWTWDDLVRCAEHLAVPNERYGLYFPLFHPNRWVIFLLQSGEAFEKDENGRYRIAGTKLFDGIEKVREIVYNTKVYPLLLSASQTDAELMFRDRQVSMILTTYMALNELKPAGFDFDVAPLPYLHEARTLLVTVGLALNKHSKVKTAAKQLIDFLVSPASQQVIRDETYSLPAYMQMAVPANGSDLPRPSRFQMYREIFPSFRQASDTKLSHDELQLVLNECKLYWSGLRSKESLIQNVEDLLNRPVQ